MSDIPNDNTTTAELVVGGAVRGVLDPQYPARDADRFRLVITQAGVYQIDATGIVNPDNSMPDMAIYLYTEELPEYIFGNDNAPGTGTGHSLLRVYLTPGAYYLTAGLSSGTFTNVGDYTIAVKPVNLTALGYIYNVQDTAEDTPITYRTDDLRTGAGEPLPIHRNAGDNGIVGVRGGTATHLNGEIVFTPYPDYTGVGLVILQVGLDPSIGALTAHLLFEVTPTPDVVALPDTAATTENQAFDIDVRENDTVSGVLTLVSAAAPPQKGGASVVDGRLAFDPGADFDRLAVGATEVVQVDYVVQDATGAQAASHLIVTVVGLNDAPVAVADVAGASENAAVLIDVLANDTDVDDGAAKALVSGSAPAGKGTATVGDGVLVFDPGAAFDHLAVGQSETVVLTYLMEDQHGAQSQASVTVTVTGANDAPVAVADAGACEENGAVSLDVLTNDFDVDVGAVISPVSAAALKGSAVFVDGRLVFDTGSDFDHLAEGAVEEVTVGYTIQDDHGALTSGAAVITVSGANDGPAAMTDSAVLDENEGGAIAVLANDVDVDDGAVLTLRSAALVAGSGSVSVSDGKIAFDPGSAFESLALGQTASVQVAYTIADEHGAQSGSTLSLTIVGSNDGPVAAADAASVIEDRSVAGNVIAGAGGQGADLDIDAGAVLTVSAAGDLGAAGVGVALKGAYGTLVLNADGSYTYAADAEVLDTLPAGTAGLQDVFSYTVRDEHGATSTAALTVSVVAAADTDLITGTSHGETLVGDREGAGTEDTIIGGNGGDLLLGHDGADTLHGGKKNDRLFGGEGRDHLYGDEGDDRLEGGAGADVFHFSFKGDDDVVTDFVLGVDRLILDGGQSVRRWGNADVDGDGVLDVVLELNGGSVTVLGVGALSDPGLLF